jgi:topoisomerase-4 subunit A
LKLKIRAYYNRDPNSQLEIVSTDYRPVVELIFPKVKGSKEAITVDIEDFIAVKGFKALGNQLTTEKIKQVNILESLPYEVPQDSSNAETQMMMGQIFNG